MVNITNKLYTLREAIATATVKVSSQQTIDAINQRKVPKGDVFEFSRAAGLLAIKKTSDVIPDCHPLPVEYAAITCRIEELSIIISVEVHTVYKTGVEVEAMHGASVAALTMYNMLKPIDKETEISSIKLQKKKGGKTDFRAVAPDNLLCAVIVCSDSVYRGEKEDRAGKAVIEKLTQLNLSVSFTEVIPDDFHLVQQRAKQLNEEKYNLLLFVGGTGLSPTDVTPDAIGPLLDREIPGAMEAARHYGQQRTPYSMLSRGVAGFINHMLVITLPGSTKGAIETMNALFPYILHVFQAEKGARHD